MPDRPLLSVIVPAHNGAGVLPETLAALAASDLPRACWELIVVDDASTDTTAEFAATYADLVVRLAGAPHGPAYARNRGVEVARGEVVTFIDADVVVHPDTLRCIAWLFADDPELGAVFGSYDDRPPREGLVSQYRNLLHHYHHQENPGEAETFWAGCGAVRTSVFREAGMFDEWHYRRPSIEDIELGHRIRRLGRRILLRPEIQCTHLKHWTLVNVVRTDLFDRGIPWMRLLLQEGKLGQRRSLNLKTVEKVKTALVGLALGLAATAPITRDLRWLAASGLIVVLVLLLSLPVYRFYHAKRGMWFALRIIPLHLSYYLLNGVAAGSGWLMHHLVGAPAPAPEVQAFAEVGLQTWPPLPRKAQGSAWAQ
jgi:cellulose synthase/poly-beta-1,6-N-acetylglucosamine synthase-like glycosyltransferase